MYSTITVKYDFLQDDIKACQHYSFRC